MTNQVCVLVFAVAVAAGAVQAPAPSQPARRRAPTSHLLSLPGGIASMKAAKPSPVSTAPGYDNQPMFSLDGTRILFAANRDGKQIDVYVFDRANGTVAQLTETPTNDARARRRFETGGLAEG